MKVVRNSIREIRVKNTPKNEKGVRSKGTRSENHIARLRSFNLLHHSEICATTSGVAVKLARSAGFRIAPGHVVSEAILRQ